MAIQSKGNVLSYYTSRPPLADKSAEDENAEILPWGTRLFLSLRWHLTPYFKMASKLPLEGEVLDLGAGHGLLSLALALQSPSRKVLAIDHDPSRVRIGAQAARSLPNLSFERGSILSPPAGRFQGIALIDVMHYFPFEEQERILQEAKARLAEEGVLIVREVHPSGGWISKWNRLYEKLATATGFTRSNKQTSLQFRTPQQWTELLTRLGFEVGSERCSSPLFADILFTARLPAHFGAEPHDAKLS